CRHPPTPTSPTAPALPEQDALGPQVIGLAAEAESLLRQQDEAVWAHWPQGAPLNIVKLYEAHPALFVPESIQKIARLRALTTDARQERALGHLWTHFVGEYLSKALSEQTEAIAALEASVAFTANGHDYPYRNLEHLLATEKDAATRRALYAGATTAVERLSPLTRLKQERAEALLKELGQSSYEAYGTQLREADLVETAALADQLLQVTQAPYQGVIDALAQRELKTPLSKLRRADFPRLFRAGGADKDFPKDAELARGLETAKALGFDLAALPNVKLDDKDLPQKNPRPLAIAVRVPDDVRLTLRPAGGARAQATFLLELGHALHYAFARESQFELARLGDDTTSEAEALVFEDLVGDPIWLQERAALSGDRLADYLASTSAFRLYRLRLQAARLLYEVQLHRADRSEAQALYAGIFGRALGITLDADEQARYAVEQEDFYASADALRAAFLAGQIQAQLKVRFGPSWWHRAEAGQFLRELWAPANSATAQELARRLGDPGIRPDSLLLRLGALLRVQLTMPAAAPPAQQPSGDGGVGADH
ncbi:MAG TPA: chromosome segregation protein SMC, partial [Myxococcaceae bacterium]|nr:chromosome segregation protein SMC [Myxococcaceae bacterium]